LPEIIYTGSFRFPDKDAAAQRVLGIAKSLKFEGFNFIFCGWEQKPRPEDKIKDLYIFQDFTYFSQSELDLPAETIFQKLVNYFRRGKKTFEWICKYTQEHSVSHVIIYNANSLFIYHMFKFCRKYNIKLICDCTEWYEGSHLPGGKFGLANVDNQIRIRFLYPLVHNVIVISTFLQNYLTRRGCNTIIIPPIIDINDSKWVTISDSCIPIPDKIIKLIYAGDPGKKDLLNSVFSALNIVNKDFLKIE